jgi:hypothetical protein
MLRNSVGGEIMNRPSAWTIAGVIILALIILGVGRLIWSAPEWFAVHEEQMTIIDAVRKTSGGESRKVDYFLSTDKGYFFIGGPIDADGTPYAWNQAENMTGQMVKVKYYGAGMWNVEAWGWYRTIYEVHKIG